MARIACTVMLKDEASLVEPFLSYHAALFGAENVYLFDNGSTNEHVLRTLTEWEERGVNVDRSFGDPDHFVRKGEIVCDLIKRLDTETDYDLYVLLDCDEFVVVKSSEGWSCNPAIVLAYFNTLQERDCIYKVSTNLSNVPGKPGVFRIADYSKTIFPRDSIGIVDHGFHSGWTRSGGTHHIATDIAYVHFHYRPHDEVVAYARRKLVPFMRPEDLADPDKLRAFKGVGWHLVSTILGGPETYYSQFEDLGGAYLFEALLERFVEIGGTAPFSNFEFPTKVCGAVGETAIPDPRILVVVDEASRGLVRGWALNIEDPEASVLLRFRVGYVVVGEVACDKTRPDVKQSGRPTDRVGFEFAPVERLVGAGGTLTAETENGRPVMLMLDGKASRAIRLLDTDSAERVGAFSSTVPEADNSVTRQGTAQKHRDRQPVHGNASDPLDWCALTDASSFSRWSGNILNLGIGVVTHNRVRKLQRTLRSIGQHTSSPYTLVVSDDGSADGTAEFLAAERLPRILGSNKGVCWNKNRLLYFLTNVLDCDIVLLVEDDCRPLSDGWEIAWIEAVRQFGHVNYAGGWLAPAFLGGAGSPADPIHSSAITGQCVGFSRKAVQRVGYFDTRFRGYGHGHVEHSSRLVRAGYGGERGAAPDGSDVFWLIRSDLEVEEEQSFREAKAVERNRLVYEMVQNEGCHRWAWRTDADMATFLAEMDAAEVILEEARAATSVTETNGTTTNFLIYLDDAKPGRVRGWAVDRSRPSEPSLLKFIVSNETIWSGIPDGCRPDILEAGYGTDRAGFVIDFSQPLDGKAQILSVLDAEDRELPITLNDGRTYTRIVLVDERAEALGWR